MNPFHDKRQSAQIYEQEPSEFRRFTLQPVVGRNKQRFGSEALFRTGSQDSFVADANTASRIMFDNWLLYGFEELISGRAIFLHCTRETLLSGFLSLLPHSAVFEIPESLRPNDEVLLACRSLKASGYRFALDDFESPENMEKFLDLADFIKVDFRNSRHRKRASMLRDLKLTQATLIAAKVESEEDFRQAVEDGFELFQGSWGGESITYEKKADPLDLMKCTCIFGAVEEPIFAVDELAELVNLESGIQCRLLRRANWASSPSVVINSTRDAFEVVEKADLQKIVTLAMTAASKESIGFRSALRKRTATSYYGADALVQWMDTLSRYDAGETAY